MSLCRDLADNVFLLDGDLADMGRLHLLYVPLVIFLCFFTRTSSVSVFMMSEGAFCPRSRARGVCLKTLPSLITTVSLIVEIVEDLFFAIAEGAKQQGNGYLLPLIYPDIENLFVIKLEVEPGPPVWDYPGGIGRNCR